MGKTTWKRIKGVSIGSVIGGGLLVATVVNSQAGDQFKDDVSFLKKYVQDLVVLSDKTGDMQIAVAPSYQGRVMTSTADGDKGASYGWINRELIASGNKKEHINALGGEDRFWIGPEGGQFSVFFAPGVKFDYDHWFTPASLDTEAFPVVEQGKDFVRFQRKISLINYSNTP